MVGAAVGVRARIDPRHRPQLGRLGQHLQRRRSDPRPGQPGADPARLLPGPGQVGRMIEQVQHGRGHGGRVVERDQHPGAGSQQVLGVVVGRGDDGAAGGHREGEGAGDDLLLGPVRRQVEVGGGQQYGQLGLGEEAVEEVHVLGQVQLADQPLQTEPVALALVLDHLRVGLAGDQVEHLRVRGHDGGQRGDGQLDALAGGDQPEGGQHRTAFEPLQGHLRDVLRRGLPGVGVHQHLGRSVRQHADAFRHDDAGVDDHPASGLGEHGDQGGPVAEGPQRGGLALRRRATGRCAG